MSRIIDSTPISVQRIRRTMRLEILYDQVTGALTQIVAHRFAVAQQGGVDVTAPTYFGTLTIQAADVPGTIATQLANLAARIDTLDTAP